MGVERKRRKDEGKGVIVMPVVVFISLVSVKGGSEVAVLLFETGKCGIHQSSITPPGSSAVILLLTDCA